MKTKIQKAFAPFKAVLPPFIWRPIRSFSTALITPVVFSLWSGHFKSSLREKALSRRNEPLPWYTYPCIQLLLHREFSGKKVLEFGGGQSTLWWASKADQVVTLEADAQWYAQLVKVIPKNVNLYLIPPTTNRTEYIENVRRVLEPWPRSSFDVIVIDSDFREDLIALSLTLLSEDGVLICDDAESYGILEASRGLDIQRVDFFGHAPGVILPRCTSIFFKNRCFLFDAKFKIPDIAIES